MCWYRKCKHVQYNRQGRFFKSNVNLYASFTRLLYLSPFQLAHIFETRSPTAKRFSDLNSPCNSTSESSRSCTVATLLRIFTHLLRVSYASLTYLSPCQLAHTFDTRSPTAQNGFQISIARTILCHNHVHTCSWREAT